MTNSMKECKFNLIKTTCKWIHVDNSKLLAKKNDFTCECQNFITTYASKRDMSEVHSQQLHNNATVGFASLF